MKILLAENVGFCFGVQNAFDKIVEIAKNTDEPVRTLGPLIHNPQTIELLKRVYNVGYVDNPAEIHDGTVVIRAHGVPPSVIEQLESAGVKVVNATCPYVIKTQRYASRLHADGRFVMIIGDPKHPEVIAILGFAAGEGAVVKKIDEIENLPDDREIGVVIQSTFIPEVAQKIIDALKDKFPTAIVYDTICQVTQNRQAEAKIIAKKCDFVLVIGGNNSANTEKLRQLAELEGAKKALKIETFEDIDLSLLEKVEKLGVLAGASTPDWLIVDIVSKIKQKFPGSKVEKHKFRQEQSAEEFR